MRGQEQPSPTPQGFAGCLSCFVLHFGIQNIVTDYKELLNVLCCRLRDGFKQPPPLPAYETCFAQAVWLVSYPGCVIKSRCLLPPSPCAQRLTKTKTKNGHNPTYFFGASTAQEPMGTIGPMRPRQSAGGRGAETIIYF